MPERVRGDALAFADPGRLDVAAEDVLQLGRVQASALHADKQCPLRVGAARASIFNNIQPFFGVLFALLILSESLHGLEIVGGALIFAGIYLERRLRQPAVAPAE